MSFFKPGHLSSHRKTHTETGEGTTNTEPTAETEDCGDCTKCEKESPERPERKHDTR